MGLRTVSNSCSIENVRCMDVLIFHDVWLVYLYYVELGFCTFDSTRGDNQPQSIYSAVLDNGL